MYLFTPIYIDFLGLEAYGITAFYTTISGLLILFDFGFSSLLTREMARSDHGVNLSYKSQIFRTLEILYFGIVLLIFISTLLFSESIAENWLHTNNYSLSEKSEFIVLIFGCATLQLLASFYQATLIGQERQVTSNLIQFLWALLRSAGVVVVFWLYEPTVYSFFGWQVFSNLLYAIVTRRFAIIPLIKTELTFKLTSLKGHYKFASGMMIITLISILNTQIDKLAVSRLLSVEAFAYYTIAAALAQAPLVLSTPISSAILPRFIAITTQGKWKEARNFFLKMNLVLAILTVPCSVTLILFAKELILLWTNDPVIVSNSAESAQYLIVGSMFLAWQIVPYNLMVSKGNTKPNIIMGLTFFLVSGGLLLILTSRLGIAGAGLSWMVANITLTVPYIYWISKVSFGVEIFWKIIRQNIAILLFSVSLLLMLRYFIGNMNNGIALFLLLSLTNLLIIFFFLRLTSWNANLKQTILSLFRYE